MKKLKPRQKRRSYIIDNIAFIQHPIERKVWFRTHYSAALVECPMCRSDAGVPCKGRYGYNVATHYARRARARREETR